jgi:predicted ABC-class ATPase
MTLPSAEDLARRLERLDGRGYPAYKDLRGGRWRFGHFDLVVDHVQGDPYAAPSRLRALVPIDRTGLDRRALDDGDRRRATRDFVARRFRDATRANRDLGIDVGGQTVLERSCCIIRDDVLELRVTVDLPAAGRRIRGREASRLVCTVLADAVGRSTSPPHLDLEACARFADVVEDQVALRAELESRDLVAFVADGSMLARRSGVDDHPLEDGLAFRAPETLAVELIAPNAGRLRGLGVRRGVTLIVGGGFHGKSTLLRALQTGVYDHVPGDGREAVVTDPTAVAIRAEDGRSVVGADISPFIDHLPRGRATNCFSTDLASGSTSQAAALVEALESGCLALLIDEDTSATNFMIRDRRMQELVAKTAEPITPFVDRVRGLATDLGVATVLVMGGSGDYLDHADTVIHMDGYLPLDVTTRAHDVATRHPTGRHEEAERPLSRPFPRALDPGSIRPERRPGRVTVGARGVDTLLLGRSEIDLRAVEQLVDGSQLRAIGWLLAELFRQAPPVHDPAHVLATWIDRYTDAGWDGLTGRPDGDLARPRVHEVMAALNRLRGVDLR